MLTRLGILVLLVAGIVAVFGPAYTLYALAAGIADTEVESWPLAILWTLAGVAIAVGMAWKREMSPEVAGEAKPLRALVLGFSSYAAVILLVALAIGGYDLVNKGYLSNRGRWRACCVGGLGLAVFTVVAAGILGAGMEQKEREDEANDKDSDWKRWTCPKCGAYNTIYDRVKCAKCGAPRPDAEQ